MKTKLLAAFVFSSLFVSLAAAQTGPYNLYGPANGIQKGSVTTYQNTSAAASDVIGLWTGTCTLNTFLKGAGACGTVNQIFDTVTNVTSASSPYSVASADSVITCDASTASVIINLPATSGSGRELTFKMLTAPTAGASCSITRAGSDTIEGVPTVVLATQYNGVKLVDVASGIWSGAPWTVAGTGTIILGTAGNAVTVNSSLNATQSASGTMLFQPGDPAGVTTATVGRTLTLTGGRGEFASGAGNANGGSTTLNGGPGYAGATTGSANTSGGAVVINGGTAGATGVTTNGGGFAFNAASGGPGTSGVTTTTNGGAFQAASGGGGSLAGNVTANAGTQTFTTGNGGANSTGTANGGDFSQTTGHGGNTATTSARGGNYTVTLGAAGTASTSTGGSFTFKPGLGNAAAQNGTTVLQDANGDNSFEIDPFGNLICACQTSTGATNGFLYQGISAGTPTGIPANTTGIYANSVPSRYDTTDDEFFFYNGSWKYLPSNVSSPTWTGTHNFTGTLEIGGIVVNPNLQGTTSIIGGSPLLAGACAAGTATVAGATSSMGVIASPSADPDSSLSTGVAIYGFVSAANTVTVRVCAIVAVTPAAVTYNVRVAQ